MKLRTFGETTTGGRRTDKATVETRIHTDTPGEDREIYEVMRAHVNTFL